MQLTSALNLVQARLDSLEKQTQIPARMTPCIEERRNLEYACQQIVSKAQQERDEMQTKALQVEHSRSEVLRTNQSLASQSEYLFQQLEASKAEVSRLKQDLKTKDEQYNLLKVATDPLVKRAEAIQTEKRQRERGAQLQQVNYWSESMEDGYRIKKPQSQGRSGRN